MRRRGFWVALAALTAGVVLLAAGCGSSSSNNSNGAGGSTAIPPHQKGGTVTVALSGNVDYLDPALAYYQSTWQIEYSTCVKLTNYKDLPGDAGHVIYPEAASAMPEVSADFRTYTIHLKRGVLFADDPAFGGKKREFTAQDVVYTLIPRSRIRCGSTARCSWRR